MGANRNSNFRREGTVPVVKGTVPRYGFVGCGNMGEALIRGLIQSGAARPNNIYVYDKNPKRFVYLKRKYRIKPIFTSEVQKRVGVIILAVKPQQAVEALDELAPHVTKRHLIISIMAGVPISFIQRKLKTKKIIRAMPNTPALIGCGMTGIYGKTGLKTAKDIFGSVGKVAVVAREKDLDAVTAISASGPAYVFKFVEGVLAAGKALGIKPELARRLILQTLIGATSMMLKTGEAPEVLRQRVTSKKGTTHAALKVMNKLGFATTIKLAIVAANKRAGALRRFFTEF